MLRHDQTICPTVSLLNGRFKQTASYHPVFNSRGEDAYPSPQRYDNISPGLVNPFLECQAQVLYGIAANRSTDGGLGISVCGPPYSKKSQGINP
jgi:hypothetical protein